MNPKLRPAILQGKVTAHWTSEWDAGIWTGLDLARLILMLAVALGLSSARAQQDIDLTGYTLAFEDNFDTLSVADTDDKGDHT